MASSITFRQEYRWLYTPFAAFVLLVSFMLSKIPNSKFKYLLVLIITLSFTGVDIYYRQFVFNVFFMDGLRTASSIKTEIIDKYGTSELSQSNIYILPDSSVIQSWYLLDDYFFKLYTNNSGIKVHYINNLNAIPTRGFENKLPLVFQVKNTQVTEVPQEIIRKAISNNILSSSYNTKYDFIENFSSGILNDDSYVSTPAGQGAFLMTWQDNGGFASETITLISQFNIRYPSIVCQSGSSLMFRAGIPYSTSDGADLYITLDSHGMNQRVAEIQLEPAAEDTIIIWSDYNIPLTDCSGGTIDITFGVDSLSGYPSADWIALADVKLVSPK